jgi:hypothetical protein
VKKLGAEDVTRLSSRLGQERRDVEAGLIRLSNAVAAGEVPPPRSGKLDAKK